MILDTAMLDLIEKHLETMSKAAAMKGQRTLQRGTIHIAMLIKNPVDETLPWSGSMDYKVYGAHEVSKQRPSFPVHHAMWLLQVGK